MEKLPDTAKWLTFLAVLLVVLTLGTGCKPPPPTPPVTYSLPELKYLLFARFDAFWCDPDLYPIARPGQEAINAREQFAAIAADEYEFTTILRHLGLTKKSDYTDEEKLLIYQQHKKLNRAVQMTSSGDLYSFNLRVGVGQGERIDGTITPSGEIQVLKREPSINTCPICLAKGTLIDTPDGPVAVEELRPGMAVWTRDGSGQRVPAEVLSTTRTPVPASFQVVKVTLGDGRTVTASPGHPTASGRSLGEFQTGDILDGSPIVSAERSAYNDAATYDLLPSGETGLYWANGILLKSTIATNKIP